MNFLTIISLVLILFSQALLFYFISSEGSDLWSGYLFSLLIFTVGAAVCLYSSFRINNSAQHNLLIRFICITFMIMNLIITLYFVYIGIFSLFIAEHINYPPIPEK